jgi:hypothetical protein
MNVPAAEAKEGVSPSIHAEYLGRRNKPTSKTRRLEETQGLWYLQH